VWSGLDSSRFFRREPSPVFRFLERVDCGRQCQSLSRWNETVNAPERSPLPIEKPGAGQFDHSRNTLDLTPQIGMFR
jgi:hypothetical protein